MTEQEWSECTDPQKMLEFLKGKSSDRRLLLFVVAARSLVDSTDTVKPAFEVAERLADGFATLDEVRNHWPKQSDIFESAWVINEFAWPERPFEWASAFVQCCPPSDDEARQQQKPTRAELILVLREIFGNPFRPVTFDPAWLRWHNGLLVSMAQQMYSNRDFADMPVLADAFEEAGCTNQDILGHCRSGGEHVRGCWVVDCLLGKS